MLRPRSSVRRRTDGPSGLFRYPVAVGLNSSTAPLAGSASGSRHLQRQRNPMRPLEMRHPSNSLAFTFMNIDTPGILHCIYGVRVYFWVSGLITWGVFGWALIAWDRTQFRHRRFRVPSFLHLDVFSIVHIYPSGDAYIHTY
jgi:hypothetical protein